MITNLTPAKITGKVAVIQMCSSHCVEDNLLTVKNFIAEAVKNKASLIVLPEMFAIMGLNAEDKVREQELFGQGKIQNFLSFHAKKHKIWIVGGTIPIVSGNKNKIRAASLVYDDSGVCVARYDKIHLFDVQLTENEIYRESDTTEPGDKIVTIDTPFGKLGLAVCYDIRFPELFRHLFNLGVDVFIVPSAFTTTTGKAHWEILAKSRAIENLCYFIGACQGGTHSNGRKTYGHSIIIGPWGDTLAKIDCDEKGIVYAEIDLKKIHEARKSIPVLEHQRIQYISQKNNQII